MMTGHHPIEEWSDQELLDQLEYVRAEYADMEVGPDDTTSPEAAIKEEIARRGLQPPQGEDLSTPGRAERDPDRR
jgi:hypothetical protein